MVQSLDCPKCGAPLNHEPLPGEETIECPYCHDMVIIPTELRVPLPRQVTIESSAPKTQRSRVITYLVIGLLCIPLITIPFLMVSGLISSWFSGDSSSATPTQEAISASDAWKKATQRASDNATATVEVKSTQDQINLLLNTERGWPAVPSVDFIKTTHGWASGDVRDDYMSGARSIGDGKYTWQVTAVKSMAYFSFPSMPYYTDFLAGVDVNLVKMPDDDQADVGLVLRHNGDAHTWYYFSINDVGQYYFGWYNGSDWQSLIQETSSSAIHLNEVNRLEVGAKDSQFIFLINGKVVDHFNDDNLKEGEIGVGINLPAKGEKATIEFANFTMLSDNTP